MNLQQPDPAILFLHDGELCELREPLSTLGIGVTERHSGPTGGDRVQAWDLVLASSRRMLSLDGKLRESPAVRIAVLEGDSNALRQMLRRAGTDLLVRLPVHPGALRLLILHSLFRGAEKRRTNRVSIGAAIRFRSGFRARNAILAELSPTGCRMLAPIGSHNAKCGANLTLQLSAELCGGRALALPGRILRVEADEHGTNAIAVNFAGLRPSTAKKLRSVIAIHSEGPAMMESEAAAALPLPPEITQHHHAGQRQAVQTLPEESIATASGTHSQQRQLPRHNLERRVIAVGQQALRVLMGRDLSTAGMRVAPARGLGVGDLLKIALYVQPSRKPLVLNAEIARDDGDAGLGLRFLDLGPEQLELITRMLDKLPGISEPDESAETTGVFVSELLARESG